MSRARWIELGIIAFVVLILVLIGIPHEKHGLDFAGDAAGRLMSLGDAIKYSTREGETPPESFDDLKQIYLSTFGPVKAYNKETPFLDPFSGEEFRFLKTDAGFVVYSIGPDKVDDGGFKLYSFAEEGQPSGDLPLIAEYIPGATSPRLLLWYYPGHLVNPWRPRATPTPQSEEVSPSQPKT